MIIHYWYWLFLYYECSVLLGIFFLLGNLNHLDNPNLTCTLEELKIMFYSKVNAVLFSCSSGVVTIIELYIYPVRYSNQLFQSKNFLGSWNHSCSYLIHLLYPHILSLRHNHHLYHSLLLLLHIVLLDYSNSIQ